MVGESGYDFSSYPLKKLTWSFKAFYFRAVGLANLLQLGSCIALYSFFLTFPQYWLKWWTESERERTAYYITGYILLFTGAWTVTNGIAMILQFRIAAGSGNWLHNQLLRTTVRAPLSYFTKTDSGSTLNRFSQDMNLIDRVLPNNLQHFAVQVFRLLAQSAILLSVQKLMGTSVPLCLAVLYFIQKFYLRTSRQLRFLDLEMKSHVYTNFLETVEGISTIRAFGWQSVCADRNIEKVESAQSPYYMMLSIQRWLNLVLDLLIMGLAVMYVALAVHLRETTTGGQVGIALNIIIMTNTVLISLIETFTVLETSLGAVARIKSFQEMVTPEDRSCENFLPPPVWPEGAIEFKSVNAAYSIDTPAAVRDITFSVSPGQKVGICGRTGNGKSSLLLTLLRLMEIVSGAIHLDGVDISQIPRDVIRERIIAVPQDSLVLDETLRKNVDPFATSSDKEIIQALTRVGLRETLTSRVQSVDNDEECPPAQGLSSNGAMNTVQFEPRTSLALDISMNFIPLSQGQQQLFSIARALLRKNQRQRLLQGKASQDSTGILLLDEATSNMDSDTDMRIQQVIKEEFEGFTILSVAHRVSTIADADIVLKMGQGGRIEKIGSFKEVLGGEVAEKDI